MEAEEVRVWSTHSVGAPESLKAVSIPATVRALLEGASPSV